MTVFTVKNTNQMITNLKCRDSYADDDLVCIMLYCVYKYDI